MQLENRQSEFNGNEEDINLRQNQLMTPNEVAIKLKVTPEQIRSLIRKGQLPAVNVGTDKKTTIPYYLVDAVVEAPCGSYPGEVPGLYASDIEYIGRIIEAVSAQDNTLISKYLEENVYSISSNQEFLEKKVGFSRLMELKRNAKIREGYYT